MEETTKITIPKMIYPKMPREDTLTRLRVMASEAQDTADRFARRDKPGEVKYYGGYRDGLLRAIKMLESE